MTRVYADRLDGSAIELDPGEHELRFDATGQLAVVKRLVLYQAEHDRRVSIVIGSPALAPPATEPALPEVPDPGARAESEPSHDGAPQRTLALVVGGVGVAALVAGGVFGLLSISAHDGYEQHCGGAIGAPAGSCDAQGVSGESDAALKGTLSTIFFVGGAAAAAAGVVLFFTAPKGSTSARVGIGPGGLVVDGRF